MRVLLVANLTAAGPALIREVSRRARAGATFHLLVPAADAHEDRAWTWEENRAWREAERRLDTALDALRAVGAEVGGSVGVHDAYAAVGDAVLAHGPFDEILISTLPPGLSRWLGLDLPTRVARRFPDSRVTHVLGQPLPEPA